MCAKVIHSWTEILKNRKQGVQKHCISVMNRSASQKLTKTFLLTDMMTISIESFKCPQKEIIKILKLFDYGIHKEHFKALYTGRGRTKVTRLTLPQKPKWRHTSALFTETVTGTIHSSSITGGKLLKLMIVAWSNASSKMKTEIKTAI